MSLLEGEALAGGGFLDLCRAAVADGDADALRRHAAGTSAEVEHVDAACGTGRRAQALAELALACLPGDFDRASHAHRAVAHWSDDGVALELAALPTREALAAALQAACLERREARLAPLSDAVELFSGRVAGGRRRAAVTLPVTDGPTGRMLTLQAGLRDGLAAGVHEALDGALAERGEDWREMEATVDRYVATVDRRAHAQAAIRYTLRDPRGAGGAGGGRYWVEQLGGESAGLALAVVARAVVRGRVSVPLDRSVAVAGRLAADGRPDTVGELLPKITPSPELPELEEAAAKRRNAQLKLVRHLVVARGQDVENIEDVIAVRPVATVEQALRAARRPLRAPLGGALVGLLVAVIAVLLLTGGDETTPSELAVARETLPGRVSEAAERLAATDPDLADLLRVEQAAVLPSVASVGALLDVYRRAIRRTTTLRPDAGGIRALAFTPGDGEQVLVGGGDGALTRFDARTGRERGSDDLTPAYGAITDVDYARDGRRVAYTTSAGGVHLRWLDRTDWRDFKAVGVVNVEYTWDGEAVVTGGRGQVGLIEGPDFATLYWRSLGTADVVIGIPRPDRRFPLLCVTDDTDAPAYLRRYDRARGTTTPVRRGRGAGTDVECPVVAVEGGRLAGLASGRRAIEIATVRDGRWEVSATLGPLPWRVRWLDAEADPEGRTLMALNRRHLAVVPQDARDGAPRTASLRRGWDVLALAAGGDRYAIANGHAEAVVVSLGDAPAGTQVSTGVLTATTVAWAAERDRLVVGGDDGDASLVDLRDPTLSRSLDLPFDERVRAVAIDPGGHVAWVAGDETVVRFELDDPDADPVVSSELERPVRALALSPDGGTLAVGAFVGGGLRLMDARRLTWSYEDDEIDVTALAWVGPDRLLVASGEQDGDQSEAALRIVDERVEPLGRVVEVPGAGYLQLTPRHPGSSRVAGAGATVAVLDASGDTPRVVEQTALTGDIMPSVAWTPDGAQLVVAGEDGAVVHDAATLARIGTLAGAEPDMPFAARGGRIALLPPPDGFALTLAPLGAEAWSQAICDRFRRTLTPGDWLREVGELPPFRTVCDPISP